MTDVTVTYGRPSVHGRRIWGELVPYGIVWRTGADEATTISFSDDVTIGGRRLPAGTYSLHAILSKDEWTLIINKVSRQIGSYEYDPSQDALRIQVKPQPADFQELLTFSFPRVTQTSAVVVLHWEKIKVGFTLEVDTISKVSATARAAVAAAKPDDWRTPLRAANWAFENEAVPEEAMQWVDQSIARRETFYNLALKARMLARAGKNSEAVSMGRRALEAARSVEPRIDATQLEKMIAEWEKSSKS